MDVAALKMLHEVVCRKGFTAAAEALYMTQPALSRKISELERDCGFKLLDRAKRPVGLTPEGEALYPFVLDLIERDAALESAADGIRKGQGVHLKICYGMGGHMPYLSAAIREVSKRFPSARFDIENTLNPEGLPRLQAGEVDAVVCNDPEAQGYRGLECHRVMPCGLVAIVPFDNPLASRASIALPELAGLPLASFARFGSPQVFDAICASLRDAGVEPSFAHLANDVVSLSAITPLYGDVAVMPATVLLTNRSQVAVVPVEGSGGFDVEVVVREGDGRPAVRELIEAFRALFGNKPAMP